MKSKLSSVRLDVAIVERGLLVNRSQAQALIMAGKVMVNNQAAVKAGQAINADDVIFVQNDMPFVSRGGLKLAKAIEEFGIDFSGKVVLDAGASTGGFTDCALQHGAVKVYAVDVGYGQLDWKLRQDERVVNIERTNIKKLNNQLIPSAVNIITADLAFISLDKVLSTLINFLTIDGQMVLLIKPQFEAGREKVGKGGVVKEPAVHEQVICKVIAAAEVLELYVAGLSWSPIKGPAGNIEYLLHLIRTDIGYRPAVAEVVATAFRSL